MIFEKSGTHIALSTATRQEIIQHCLSMYPKEACGMLAGNKILLPGEIERTAHHVYRMKNVEDSPIGYSMDPKEQLLIEKDMRQRHLYTLGIYHSHTATDVEPSTVDVSLAISPDISYVIVSLKDRNDPVLRSYRIVDGKILKEEDLWSAKQ